MYLRGHQNIVLGVDHLPHIIFFFFAEMCKNPAYGRRLNLSRNANSITDNEKSKKSKKNLNIKNIYKVKQIIQSLGHVFVLF